MVNHFRFEQIRGRPTDTYDQKAAGYNLYHLEEVCVAKILRRQGKMNWQYVPKLQQLAANTILQAAHRFLPFTQTEFTQIGGPNEVQIGIEYAPEEINVSNFFNNLI